MSGRRLCDAKSKRTKLRCRALAMTGSVKCYHHGGMSLKGIAHPNFTEGYFSKAMPPMLRGAFLKAQADPDLLSLARRVALLDARLAEVLPKTAEPGGDWRAAVQAFDKMDAAQAAKNVEGARQAWGELRAAIKGGGGAEEALRERWREIDRLIEGARRLIDSIQKHQVQQAQVVTLMQMNTLFTGLANLVRKEFVRLTAQMKDERQKKAIQEALRNVSVGFQKLGNVTAPLLLAETIQEGIPFAPASTTCRSSQSS